MASQATTATVIEDSGSSPMFNGGKMKHVFQTDEKTYMYLEEFTSAAAEEALKHGTIYIKIHGSNGALVWMDGKIHLYQRHDLRGKAPKGTIPAHHITLPSGGNPDTLPNHQYFYEWVNPEAKKKLGKKNRAMYALVEKHQEYLEHELKAHDGFMTVEWVGRKFNGTPGVDADIALCLHHEQVPLVNVPRTFHSLKTWLMEQGVEGIVVEHQGVFWKIRTDCFHKPFQITTPPVKVYV